MGQIGSRSSAQLAALLRGLNAIAGGGSMRLQSPPRGLGAVTLAHYCHWQPAASGSTPQAKVKVHTCRNTCGEVTTTGCLGGGGANVAALHRTHIGTETAVRTPHTRRRFQVQGAPRCSDGKRLLDGSLTIARRMPRTDVLLGSANSDAQPCAAPVSLQLAKSGSQISLALFTCTVRGQHGVAAGGAPSLRRCREGHTPLDGASSTFNYPPRSPPAAWTLTQRCRWPTAWQRARQHRQQAG